MKGKSDADVYGCHRDREIVAGKPLFLHDTCKGDSGGPFFVKDAKGRLAAGRCHVARHRSGTRCAATAGCTFGWMRTPTGLPPSSSKRNAKDGTQRAARTAVLRGRQGLKGRASSSLGDSKQPMEGPRHQIMSEKHYRCSVSEVA